MPRNKANVARACYFWRCLRTASRNATQTNRRAQHFQWTPNAFTTPGATADAVANGYKWVNNRKDRVEEIEATFRVEGKEVSFQRLATDQ
jgi:hypothetical protein